MSNTTNGVISPSPVEKLVVAKPTNHRKDS